MMKPLSQLIVTAAMWTAGASSLAAEDAFPDPGPDTVWDGAIGLTTNVPVAGEIEVDIDRDIYSVSVQGGKQYDIRVTPGPGSSALRNAEVDLLAGGGMYPRIQQFDTVREPSATGSYAQPNGSNWTVYVSVGGFKKFTTGAYEITVEEKDVEDADGDGLPDAWERAQFPNDAIADVDPDADPDGDGLTTREEFLLGTDPDDLHLPSQALAITSMEGVPPNRITWNSMPMREYAVVAVPSLPLETAASTDEVGRVKAYTESSSLMVSDPSSERRFYHVRVTVPASAP